MITNGESPLNLQIKEKILKSDDLQVSKRYTAAALIFLSHDVTESK